MPINQDTNIVENRLNIDSKIGVTVHDWAANHYFERTTAQDVYHVEAKVIHDSLDGVMRGGTSLFPFEGEISITWNVEDIDVDTVKADLSDWKSMVDRADVSVSEDWTANTITATLNANYNHNDWVSHPFAYVPLSNSARIDAGDSGAKIACVMRLVDVDDWAVEYKTISSETTITKSGSDCYVFFSTDYSINGTDYDAYTVKRLTSSSVDVTPTGRCTVIKIYK